MKTAKKVVLVSKNGYDPSHDAILQSLVDRKIELFCVVGVECELWEAVMDELVVGPDGTGAWDVTTTSHPDETVAEVLAFAEAWQTEAPCPVQLIEL